MFNNAKLKVFWGFWGNNVVTRFGLMIYRLWFIVNWSLVKQR
jgi:hypothetical protein